MPKEKPDAELVLSKLGQRLREGFAQKHPTQDKDLEMIKTTVGEQYSQEQKTKRERKPGRDASKEKEQERRSPELDKD